VPLNALLTLLSIQINYRNVHCCSTLVATAEVQQYCEMQAKLNVFHSTVESYIQSLGKASTEYTSSRATAAYNLLQRDSGSVLQRELYEARALLWENLHHVHWKDTCDLERDLYCILTARLVFSCLQSAGAQPCVDYAALAKVLDVGLLMGSSNCASVVEPLMDYIQEHLSNAAHCISLRVPSNIRLLRNRMSRHRLETLSEHANFNGGASVLPSEHSLSLVRFYNECFSQQKPVVMKGCMDEWPALQPASPGTTNFARWSDLSYLLRFLGHRTVPVETGASYLSTDSGSSFMTGQQFVEQYIVGCPPGDAEHVADAGVCLPVAYLAQHRLLDQIPRLREDIIIPDYCALLQDVDDATPDEAAEVKVQAWLGPVGTVSPLHHDPYYNILAQVAGASSLTLLPGYSVNRELVPCCNRLQVRSGL
jgi:hypothetical protein